MIGDKNGLEKIELGIENGVYNQTLYITYKTAAEAKLAFSKLNNFKFTKEITFVCFTIREIQEVLTFQ